MRVKIFDLENLDASTPALLSYENLPPMGRVALDMVVENRIRRRENPRWAAAMDALAILKSLEAWE